MLKTLDFTIRIVSTPTFLYFDLYLNTAYAAHYGYVIILSNRYNIMSGRSIWDLQCETETSRCKSLHTDQLRILYRT